MYVLSRLRRQRQLQEQALLQELTQAVLDGKVEIIKEKLSNGVSVDYEHGLLLRKAATCGHLAIVELLLDKGANINAHDSLDCGDALFEAIRCGHEKVVNLLIL
jgi:hypothetical protein